MNKNDNKKEHRNGRLYYSRNLWCIIGICILLMLLLEAGIQNYSNTKLSSKTIKSLLEQVVSIVDKNATSDEKLEDALKEEYMIRARAVSYVIEHDETIEQNLSELLKVADLMEVDEIHLFDKEGVIYNGSVPEYYGINMNAGDQIGFFKQMLSDTSLSLCQNMMPNTADGKEMMYAMVWREDKSGLVQIGIEPLRLLQELQSHEIVGVIDAIPVVEGETIIIADSETGEICASTHKVDIGKSLSDIGYEEGRISIDGTHKGRVHSKHILCASTQYDKYTIITAYDMKIVNKGMLVVLAVILIYLILAAFIIFRVVKQLDNTYVEKKRDYDVLLSMSRMYNSVYLVNLEENTCSEYTSRDSIRKILSTVSGADAQMRAVMSATITDEYKEKILEFTNLTTLPERMQGKKYIFCDVVGRKLGWTRTAFITLETDENDRPKTVIYTTQDIDEQKREEEKLLLTSNTDELTKLYNRRAFEQDIDCYRSKEEEYPEDFLLISMDLNGLKRVNDSAGHAAGDEMIIAAANCMRTCFMAYGRIYRMGGDEFTALLHVQESEVEKIMAGFDAAIKGFKGELVDSLSISYGYVTGKEAKGKEYQVIEKLADDRMYLAKKHYYETMGIDRRR